MRIVYLDDEYNEKDIVSGNCNIVHSMVGESLGVDTFDFKLFSESGQKRRGSFFLTADEEELELSDGELFKVFVDDGSLADYIRGDEVFLYNNKLINRFYVDGVNQVSKNIFEFKTVSAISLLGETWHNGGVYQGETVEEVLTDILSTVLFEIDDGVKDIKLYGWLPRATRRENLQQVLLATSLTVKTTPDGKVYVTVLNNDIKNTFDETNSVMGGSLKTSTKYSAIQITEHTYQEIDTEITLYDDIIFSEELIVFSEPVHNIVVTGGTVKEMSANHIIVQGEGTVLITGKQYLHTKRVVTKGELTGNPTDKILTVDNFTLINPLNITGVMDKLDYAFSKTATVHFPVLWNGETAGDVVKVLNPVTLETEEAFSRGMDINFSSNAVANGEFVLGYLPSGAITGYTHKIVLTEGDTFTAPFSTEYLVVMIGGGQGGNGGNDGASGGCRTNGGVGGNGGSGGLGGKVARVILDLTENETVNISFGEGGLGTNTIGEQGTATTFGAYSSENGKALPFGYADFLDGELFAQPGGTGLRGGDGAPDMPVTTVEYKGRNILSGNQGQTRSGHGETAYGGFGGGASAGANGLDGQRGSILFDGEKYFAQNGNGGAGSTPVKNDNATGLGQGGHGGHGGGGGGSTYGGSIWVSAGGGGKGGAGGDGAKGCIIIYYKGEE